MRRFERPEFRDSVGRLLIDHLSRLSQDPLYIEQRVRIIHSLASFPSSLTAKALQRELARRGLFRLLRAPAEVRQAAQQSLAKCKREIH